MNEKSITKLYAWIHEDINGKQGILSFFDESTRTYVPAISSKKEILKEARLMIESIGIKHEKKIHLIEFSDHKILETIDPFDNIYIQ